MVVVTFRLVLRNLIKIFGSVADLLVYFRFVRKLLRQSPHLNHAVITATHQGLTIRAEGDAIN